MIIIPKPDPPNVIVVPQSATSAQANSVTIQGFRSRLWSIAKIIGPSSVAVAAIIISLLTYENQHQANQAAAISYLRQQAVLVSFLQQQGNEQPNGIIAISNYSEAPVSDAALLGKVILNGKNSFSVAIPLGSIPACSLGHITGSMIAAYFKGATYVHFSATADTSGFTNGDILNKNYRLTVESMYFTDDNGIDWQYPEGGPLETAQLSLGSSVSIGSLTITGGSASGLIAGENDSKYLAPSYTQSTNCT